MEIALNNKKLRILVIGLMALLTGPFGYAQIEIKNTDRIKYAEVGYSKVGFGEVNNALLNKRQAHKLNQQIEKLRQRFGVVVVFASLIPEEVQDTVSFIEGYLGLDPRALRNHVGIEFGEKTGDNEIMLGSDNARYFNPEALSQLFIKTYNDKGAFRSMKKTLTTIKRVYRQLDDSVKESLRHPKLTSNELLELGVAKMDWLKDLESTPEIFTRAIALDPGNVPAYTRLGYVLTEQRDMEAAEDAFLKAWSLKPDFETALGCLTLYYRIGETKKVAQWKAELQNFKSDYEQQVEYVALYNGDFITESARTVFDILFEDEIKRVKDAPDTEATRVPGDPR